MDVWGEGSARTENTDRRLPVGRRGVRLTAGRQLRGTEPSSGLERDAGEESAREPTSVIHFLGTQGISLRVCGAENPSQGPWEPGALGAALILGGLETAGGALQLPFPSL